MSELEKRRALTTPPLASGSTIGILGGGQLGRMLALAAAELGLQCHIYCPESEAPALDVTRYHTIAPYEDPEALKDFAGCCHAVTCETENLPLESLAFLSTLLPVHPGTKSLRISQDRWFEKKFLSEIGLPVAPFYPIHQEEDLAPALREIGIPAILKTRRFGYDGKGQARILEDTQLQEAWEMLNRQPAILEGFVPFDKEISVLACRGQDGQVLLYDPCENEHRDQILRYTHIPANIPPSVAKQAAEIAGTIANALDHIGMLAVELFLQTETDSGTLVVNEIAPRVHNSGHWTMDACSVSQFEQHLRAVAGWSLGDPTRHHDVVMENLIGEDVTHWQSWLPIPSTSLHLYGKSEIREGRKMGHVNRLLSPAKK